jgi:disulfide bond formation protein DsbB
VSVEFVRTFTAMAALAANVLTVALVVGLVATLRSDKVRGAVAQIGDSALFLAGFVALACMVGSLYYSEVAHFIPCRFCWYQRIAMYPLVVVLLVGAFTRDFNVRRSGVILAASGAALATYHYSLEQGWIEDTGSCDPTAPCSAPWFWEFGFVTIAYMAFSGFLLILALLATTWVAPPAAAEREPDGAEESLNIASAPVEELVP